MYLLHLHAESPFPQSCHLCASQNAFGGGRCAIRRYGTGKGGRAQLCWEVLDADIQEGGVFGNLDDGAEVL